MSTAAWVVTMACKALVDGNECRLCTCVNQQYTYDVVGNKDCHHDDGPLMDARQRQFKVNVGSFMSACELGGSACIILAIYASSCRRQIVGIGNNNGHQPP